MEKRRRAASDFLLTFSPMPIRISLASLLVALLASLLATSLLVAQAGAIEVEQEKPSATTPEEAYPFAKVYILPPPLPTTGRLRASEQSLPELLLQQDKTKTFPKHYRLAQTFAIPSLESRKPVESTQAFQRQTKLPDPLEKLNRSAFRTTIFFEKAVLRPLAKGWRKIPRPITAPIINFSRNLSRTTDFLNALAQGNPKRASEVFFAFVLDSTLGFAGLINLSEHLGIPQVEEDFGQTLAHYGVGHGAYFVSFLLGPSSVRDTAGNAVDLTASILGKIYLSPYWNPLDYLLFVETSASVGISTGVRIGLGFIRSVDSYSKVIDQIKALEQGSLDFYIATRRFYAYRRALQVLNAENLTSAPSSAPSQEDDPFADIEE